jgi:protease-4
MKQFFKFMFASCLGMALALGLLTLVGFGILGSAMSSSSSSDEIKANSILTIKLNGPVPEKTNNAAANPYAFETDDIVGLMDMIKGIERAKDDDDIKGIYIDTPIPSLNFASLAALRKAIEDFKESGKFVIAYADYYSESGYYLASVADKVYLNPVGQVDFNGFVAQIPFFKEMLDKIGVKYEIFYAGDFKSATEPYRLNKMSDNNRQQTREYINDVYRNYLTDLSASRKITVSELRKLADELLIQDAEDAVKYQLVDSLMYKDMLLANMSERLGLDPKKVIPTVSLEKYTTSTQPKVNYKAKDKIAVIYAEGTIVGGSDKPGMVTGDGYSKMIRKIRKDKKVKAIVLRVNSPGGSGLASEKIWRELTLAKEQDIKIVVSMGDYAASGGYYIACMADTILAEKNTLTGSIGVFSMFPNAQKLMNDKLGVRFDTVKTNEYALGPNVAIELSQKEKDMMTAGTTNFYETFLKRVSDGRGMTRDEAHAVAQGRIWTGTRAKELGLVDAIGGLDDAMEIAANMAGLDKFRAVEYPKTKAPLEQLIQDFTGQKTSVKQAMLKEELGEMYPYYERVKTLQSLQGVQALMPYQMKLD